MSSSNGEPTLPHPNQVNETQTIPPLRKLDDTPIPLQQTPPQSVSTSSETAPSTTIPGYELLGSLGRGGMGIVYKAIQTQTNRLVALKMILHAAHANESDLLRFYSEAKAIGNFSHPGIVQIYEVGKTESGPYLALEYCPNGTLAQKLAGEPLPPSEAIHLIQKLANATQYAHEKKILHRDLKPANILLAEDFSPKITDFGLAKTIDTDSGQTRTGAIMGTPSYMAPEQALGETKTVGPTADIYALGAILYETLTGRPPFRGSSALETLEMVRSQEPVPPRLLNTKVPIDLETICLKCLQKDPKKRYSTAKEFAEDLQRWADKKPILARPVTKLEKTWKLAKRNPAISGLLIGLVCAILGGTTGIYFQLREARAETKRANKNFDEAEQQARIANEKSTFAQLKEQEANAKAIELATQADFLRKTLYATKIHVAESAWQLGETSRVREILKELMPKEGETDLRGFEWDYLNRSTRGSVRRLELPQGKIAFSPNDRFFAGGANPFCLLETHTGREFLTLKEENPQGILDEYTCVAFSPDQSKVVSILDEKTLRVTDLRTQKQIRTLTVEGHARALAFSPDGTKLAAATSNGGIRVWDFESGKIIFENKEASEFFTAWIDDEQLMGFVTFKDIEGAAGIVSWNLSKKGEETKRIRFEQASAAMTYCIEKGLLVLSGLDKVIRVFDIKTTKLISSFQGSNATVQCVTISDDGKFVAAGGTDQMIRIWDTESGRLVSTLRGHQGTVHALSFNHRGNLLASNGNDGVHLWEPLNDVEKTLFPPEQKGQVVGFFRGNLWTITKNEIVEIHPITKEVLQTFPLKRNLIRIARHTTILNEKKAIIVTVEGEQQQNTVSCYSLLDGKQLWTRSFENHDFTNIVFSLDGSQIFCSGFVNEDGKGQTIHALDIIEGKTIKTYSKYSQLVWLPPKKQWLALEILPEGGRLSLLDEELKPLSELSQDQHLTPRAMRLSSDGRFVAVTSMDDNGVGVWLGTVRVWDLEHPEKKPVVLSSHSEAVTDLAISPDGKRIVTVSDDRSLKIWDRETGQELLAFSDHPLTMNRVLFSGTGESIAFTYFDGEHSGIGAYSISAKVKTKSHLEVGDVLKGTPSEKPTRAVLSPDGELLAFSHPTALRFTTTNQAELPIAKKGLNEVKILDLAVDPKNRWVTVLKAKQKPQMLSINKEDDFAILEGDDYPYSQLATNSDGSRLCAISLTGTLTEWDTATGKILFHSAKLSNVALTLCCYHPKTSALVVVDENGSIIRVERDQKKQKSKVVEATNIRAIEWAPNLEDLLVFTLDGKIGILKNDNAWEELHTFAWLEFLETTARFTPDGRYLAVSGPKHTAFVIDTKTGKEVARFLGQTGGCDIIGISTDGKTIFLADDDAQIRYWEWKPKKE